MFTKYGIQIGNILLYDNDFIEFPNVHEKKIIYMYSYVEQCYESGSNGSAFFSTNPDPDLNLFHFKNV